MINFELDKLVRPNIKALKPYSSARTEFQGHANVFLDANENAYGSPSPEFFNRYPDPLQWALKFKVAKIKGVPAENIFAGNGSDEAIDLAYRIFCGPGKDNVIICPPTYGMYEVSAAINNVEVKKVNLTGAYQLDTEAIIEAIDNHTKLIFICSPNNPTGNNMRRSDIEFLLNNFNGIVLVDEAYINFSKQKTFIAELTEYPNLVVMQTLSKAWGLAALRIGLCYASMDIIDLFNKVKPPYNVNGSSQAIAAAALDKTDLVNEWIRETVAQRTVVADALTSMPFVQQVFPSDANFLLAKVTDADALYSHLTGEGIVIRNRNNDPLSAQCIRITIGTAEENEQLLSALKKYAP